MNDNDYDLVYILKADEKNTDLKYSLRSVSRFCRFRNIWFVGYQPSWTQNVKFLPTVQTSTKWKNSTLNVLTACQCDEISNEFILMNDDFVALREVNNWRTTLNLCLGTIEEKIQSFKDKKNSQWREGFKFAQALLILMHSPTFINYEVHAPMIINRHRFLEVYEHSLLKWFRGTSDVLMKRTIYSNMAHDPDLPEPRKIRDVKISADRDLVWSDLKEGWLSVFDNVIGNGSEYPLLNQYLRTEFPNRCQFEK